MRAALFAPVKKEETEKIGHLAESAIFSQWQHSFGFKQLRYARWKNEGEVDIVYLEGAQERPLWIGEIKWSDRIKKHPDEETKGLRNLIGRHESISSAFITTRSYSGELHFESCRLPITAFPSSLHCYRVGRNITTSLDVQSLTGKDSEEQIKMFAASDDEDP